jgi:ABC-type nitrate/sulfonate/bicarbonate transport system substrate-binding protein
MGTTMKKVHYIGMGISVAVFAAVLFLASSAPQTDDAHGATPATGAVVASYANETIRIGMSSVQPLNGLLTVASEQGFFSQEGLNVQFTEFASGKDALQAFLGGSLDLTATGEVPATFSLLNGGEFYILTQLVEKTKGDIRIVALKDGGLSDTSAKTYFSAKKRKLATSFGGGPEFYTYNFLRKYNISDVELVNVKPADMPAALASGSVDAIAVFEPFAFIAEGKLPNGTVSFSDEAVYSEFFLLLAHKEWISSHAKEAEEIVAALKKASDFIAEEPQESKAIVAKSTKLDLATIDGIWDKYVFKPALTSGLLKYMSAEAAWAKETGKAGNETVAPNFSSFVYKAALKEVAPAYVAM